MESVRIPFKKDDFGNDILTRLTWFKDEAESPKPIVLVYHGGGLMVGSSEVVPQPQVEWLAKQGFLVVIPNYRLAPQVNGVTSFADGVEAYDWAASHLGGLMKSQHGVVVDATNIVVTGHSSGGTLALHLASCRPVKAVTSFYPSLYFADTSTSSHKPYNDPPFDKIPDYSPTKEDWEIIAPARKQITESGLTIPDAPPSLRSRWQAHVSTRGLWVKTLCPDGDYAVLDPLTRLNPDWPPVMFVHGEIDGIPGSELSLLKRAEKDMRDAGLKEVVVKVVPGVGHAFDMMKPLGTEDFGEEWQAVVEGLQFLVSHARK